MPKPSSYRLEILYRISQTINSSLDLPTALDILIDESSQAAQADRGFLMLYDGQNKIVFKTARGMDQRTIEKKNFKISSGVMDSVAYEGQPLFSRLRSTDPCKRLKIYSQRTKSRTLGQWPQNGIRRDHFISRG